MTSPDAPLSEAAIRIGVPVVHVATNLLFRVLCNCPTATPRMHTQRFVAQNLPMFRQPTADELARLGNLAYVQLPMPAPAGGALVASPSQPENSNAS